MAQEELGGRVTSFGCLQAGTGARGCAQAFAQSGFQRFVENLAIYLELPPAEVQYVLSKQFNPAREIKYRHLLHEKIRNHYKDMA